MFGIHLGRKVASGASHRQFVGTPAGGPTMMWQGAPPVRENFMGPDKGRP